MSSKSRVRESDVSEFEIAFAAHPFRVMRSTFESIVITVDRPEREPKQLVDIGRAFMNLILSNCSLILIADVAIIESIEHLSNAPAHHLEEDDECTAQLEICNFRYVMERIIDFLVTLFVVNVSEHHGDDDARHHANHTKEYLQWCKMAP